MLQTHPLAGFPQSYRFLKDGLSVELCARGIDIHSTYVSFEIKLQFSRLFFKNT